MWKAGSFQEVWHHVTCDMREENINSYISLRSVWFDQILIWRKRSTSQNLLLFLTALEFMWKFTKCKECSVWHYLICQNGPWNVLFCNQRLHGLNDRELMLILALCSHIAYELVVLRAHTQTLNSNYNAKCMPHPSKAWLRHTDVAILRPCGAIMYAPITVASALMHTKKNSKKTWADFIKSFSLSAPSF